MARLVARSPRKSLVRRLLRLGEVPTYRLDQRFPLVRFANEADGARRRRSSQRRGSGDGAEWDVAQRRVRLHRFGEFPSVHLRHHEIHDDECWFLEAHQRECLASVSRFDNAIPRVGKQLDNAPAKIAIVVDHKYVWPSCHGSSRDDESWFTRRIEPCLLVGDHGFLRQQLRPRRAQAHGGERLRSRSTLTLGWRSPIEAEHGAGHRVLYISPFPG